VAIEFLRFEPPLWDPLLAAANGTVARPRILLKKLHFLQLKRRAIRSKDARH